MFYWFPSNRWICLAVLPRIHPFLYPQRFRWTSKGLGCCLITWTLLHKFQNCLKLFIIPIPDLSIHRLILRIQAQHTFKSLYYRCEFLCSYSRYFFAWVITILQWGDFSVGLDGCWQWANQNNISNFFTLNYWSYLLCEVFLPSEPESTSELKETNTSWNVQLCR